MAGEQHSDRMTSDMEVQMKQRCKIEFLHTEKMESTGIHQHLLNIYGDQTVDVSTVKAGLCGQCFPSNDVVVAVVKQRVTSAGADFYEYGELLFITGENAQLMVVTMLKNSIL